MRVENFKAELKKIKYTKIVKEEDKKQVKK
jgi:hypothetical protein